MGWDYCRAWKTKDDVVAAAVRDCGGPERVVATRVTSGIAWLAIGPHGGDPGYIVCALLYNEGARALKLMSEHCHPYYYDCPLDLLDMVPGPDTDNSRKWRSRVREQHAERAVRVS